MGTIKSWLLKKYLKRKNRGHGFVCSWLATYQWRKKNIENSISVGVGAHKVGKIVSFWPNLELNFTDIWVA